MRPHWGDYVTTRPPHARGAISNRLQNGGTTVVVCLGETTAASARLRKSFPCTPATSAFLSPSGLDNSSLCHCGIFAKAGFQAQHYLRSTFMSSKTPVDNADSFTTPLSISQSDILLASTITLPSHPHVAYATFTSNNDDAVERARRLIFSGSQGRAILDSLLPSIHTSKDVSTFFVFAITSPKQIGDRYAALTALKFDEVDSEC